MYYADLDEDTGMYCVFCGEEDFAYSSWATMEQAQKDADYRNGYYGD